MGQGGSRSRDVDGNSLRGGEEAEEGFFQGRGGDGAVGSGDAPSAGNVERSCRRSCRGRRGEGSRSREGVGNEGSQGRGQRHVRRGRTRARRRAGRSGGRAGGSRRDGLPLLSLLGLPLSAGDDAGDGPALGAAGLAAALGTGAPGSAHAVGTEPATVDAAGSPSVHDDLPLLAVLAGLGELLEVLLRMGADLDDGPRLDEGGDLLPALAVLLEPLQEEAMFLGGPSAGVLPALGRRGGIGRAGGGHGDVVVGRAALLGRGQSVIPRGVGGGADGGADGCCCGGGPGLITGALGGGCLGGGYRRWSCC